jgi:hypothetical protein
VHFLRLRFRFQLSGCFTFKVFLVFGFFWGGGYGGGDLIYNHLKGKKTRFICFIFMQYLFYIHVYISCSCNLLKIR